MEFQHFRFLAPPSPHIYPSHVPSKAFRLHFSLSDHFFHDFSENVIPACIGSTIPNIATKHFQWKIPRLGPLFAGLAYPWPSWPFKKTFKNQWNFNIFAFWPYQARTYTIHMCHLRFFGSIFQFPTTFFMIFLKMSSPPTQETQFWM